MRCTALTTRPFPYVMQTAWDLWQARDRAEEMAVEKFAAG